MSSVFAPAGPAAAWIAEAGGWLFAGGALIFIGVMGLLALSLRDGAGRVRRGLWLVGGGLVFPTVVLSALLVYAFAGMERLGRPAAADAMVVTVVGHMWWWELRYRDPANGGEIVLANELRLPVGRQVRLGLESADVIHSLWVPALAGKVDLVPGRVNHLVVQADAPGVFRGPCAEYCGDQHARMELRVAAMPPAEFDAWLAAQALPARPPADALQARGRQAFVEQRCAVCHVVRGAPDAGAQASAPAGRPSPSPELAPPPGPDRPLTVGPEQLPTVGPDLTHVGSRLSLGAGILPNNRANLAAWIRGVQHLKRGARMPSFDTLDAATLEALAAYLESLK